MSCKLVKGNPLLNFPPKMRFISHSNESVSRSHRETRAGLGVGKVTHCYSSPVKGQTQALTSDTRKGKAGKTTVCISLCDSK